MPNFAEKWPSSFLLFFLCICLFVTTTVEQLHTNIKPPVVRDRREQSLIPFTKERSVASDDPAVNHATAGEFKEPPSESNMDLLAVADFHPHALQDIRFRKLRPVGALSRTGEGNESFAVGSHGENSFSEVIQLPTIAPTTRLITGGDSVLTRKAMYRMQLNEAEAIQRLETTTNELQEVQQLLNATILERNNAKEYGRVMENSYAALKLENDMMARASNAERLKTRRLQDQLADAMAGKKVNVNIGGSLSAPSSGNISAFGSNVTDSWDTKETIYNGDRWHRNWDGRESTDGSANVTGTRVIFFLRHGHYEYSIPEDQIEMTELGKKQMEALGIGLSMLKYRWNKRFLHSSKLRTKQAAEIIAKHIPGLILQPSHLIWSCSYDNDSERRQEAFKEYIFRASPLQHRTSYELVMTHSSVIRYFVERALQVTYGTISLPLIHGSITRVEIPPDGRVILREFGEFSHMPRELLSLSNAKWRPAEMAAIHGTSPKPPAAAPPG